jgi:tetratricopeptide (TPR) repeat protein
MTKHFFTAALIVSMLLTSIPGFSQSKTSPDVSAVPKNVVQLLASGDLKKAVFAMRELPDCPKASYLMHSASRIVLFGMEKNPSKSSAHEVYQNIAIAYHNLYLFLKGNGIDQEAYFGEAERYYSMARRTGTYLHKAECDVLEAALIAASGDAEKAMKKFSKVDEFMLRGDFESMEYLAVYYAAVRDAAKALEALDAAFAMSPTRTLAWLEVSDDFEPLKDDAGFAARLSSWRTTHETSAVTLSLPKCEAPRLQMTSTDPFGPLGYTKKARKQLSTKNK